MLFTINTKEVEEIIAESGETVNLEEVLARLQGLYRANLHQDVSDVIDYILEDEEIKEASTFVKVVDKYATAEQD